MLFEDEVLGVLVLSKLGLHQFRPDDLRLLEIYASLAAQAMANADATELLRGKSAELEQKVRGQRELLGITESILTTLDPPVLLGTIADRLGELIGSDNILIELMDEKLGLMSRIAVRKSVVLPDPFGPRTATISRLPRRVSMPWRTSRPS